MENEPILGLIKFGSSENLEKLRSSGQVYMNTWGYFKRLESNQVQGDKDEGLVSMYQTSKGANLMIRVDGDFQPIKHLTGQIKFTSGKLEDFNLFCLFALTTESFSYLSDERIQGFGDSALTFLNGDEFLGRLRKRLKEEDLAFESALVEYVKKEEFHGKMGPFRKLETYSYQNEVRIFVQGNCSGPLKINIPSIEDISVIVPINDVTKHLRIIKGKEKESNAENENPN